MGGSKSQDISRPLLHQLMVWFLEQASFHRTLAAPTHNTLWPTGVTAPALLGARESIAEPLERSLGSHPCQHSMRSRFAIMVSGPFYIIKPQHQAKPRDWRRMAVVSRSLLLTSIVWCHQTAGKYPINIINGGFFNGKIIEPNGAIFNCHVWSPEGI